MVVRQAQPDRLPDPPKPPMKRKEANRLARVEEHPDGDISANASQGAGKFRPEVWTGKLLLRLLYRSPTSREIVRKFVAVKEIKLHIV